jgi:hypothetical protein
MANSTNLKNSSPAAPAANNSSILTVVVLDAKSQPVAGAQVSITPSDASGVTNNAGEIQFKLGNAAKYNVTASTGSSTVTVPYYLTKNGATRLIVNPAYVRTAERQLHPLWFESPVFLTVGLGLGIIIILAIVWKLFRRSKSK